MRGDDIQQGGMFSYVSLEARVPNGHPLRSIKALLDEALAGMSRDFDKVYAKEGRPSIPPERLVRASTLQILYSIRSERLLCEQLDYNLLFRWFVGLSIDEPIWDHSSFTKNRDRLIEARVARKLLRRIVRKARDARLLSNEHFSVDGTLIESWAAVKSMRRRDGKDDPPGPGRNPTVNWHGEKRNNETHEAPKDPEAKLFCKGKGQTAKLNYMGHVLMDHREGLIVDVEVTEANGNAEREAALTMINRHPSRERCTLAGDKAYDTKQFVANCRKQGVTPHVAMNTSGARSSAIDARTTRHAGYHVSQRLRKRIEECFGWCKDGRPLRKMKVYGKRKVEFVTTLTVGIYTLIRVTTLLRSAQPAPA
ncbi:MAG TPA: IS5 family transposase [Steroidobacteraceae bacterium]|nr:IS5 family transposase [Steroidobacteraceae bacterium]